MAMITYVEFDGTAHTIDVKGGFSLTEGAVLNGIPGIDAECGGACACATCHVYVAPTWIDELGPRSEIEEAMLELAENSRLSCQIKVSENLNGLVVHMPSSQH